MRFEELLARFDRVRRVGPHEAFVRCPNHDDHDPSLHVTDEDGTLLLHDFGGCQTHDILAKIGVTLGDLRNGTGPAVETPETVYTYTDETGTVLFQVVRFPNKKFRQRRPEGDGWTWKLGDVRRVLYRLPSLKECPTVFHVEGEKDADRLAALGWRATTSPGGADNWRDEYGDLVVAAGVQEVIVFPDRDDAGEHYAAAVVASYQRRGLRVKLVRLPVKDVSDYLATIGTTLADLAELVERTPWLPIPDAPGPAIIRLDTVAPEEIEWLWPGRIPRGKLTLLIGDPGLGKSFLLLDVAARISTGAPWPDGGHAPLGDAVLLSSEDGLADTIRPRLDALHADVSRIHALSGIREPEGGVRPFSLESDLQGLEAVITRTGAALASLDPISAYLGSRDSYKDSEIRGLLGPLAALAERRRVAIVGIVHLSKDQQRKALYRALGSVAFVAAARLVLAVGKDPDDEERRLLVPVKANICAPASPLAYTLSGGVLTWSAEPVARVDVETVLSGAGGDREERTDAEAFLRGHLADGGVLATDVIRAAEANGITMATLRRAKSRLQIQATKEGFGRQGVWRWSLPPKDAHGPSKGAHSEKSEHLSASTGEKSRKDAHLPKDAQFTGSERLSSGGEHLSGPPVAVPPPTSHLKSSLADWWSS